MHTVEEAMTVEVITVGPDEPVTVAARIMRDAGVSLVVDASGAVIGILTETILRSVRCSVLALKPEGFVSPVRPEPNSGKAAR